MTTRYCSGCKRDLAVENFHKHPSGKLGRSNRCKDCLRTYQRDYHQRPDVIERKLAYAAKWRKDNAEAIKKSQHDRYSSSIQERMHRSAKQSSVARGLEFDLTVDDIKIPDACPVFGTPFVVGTGRAHPDSASLDRVDSSKGYVRDNIWVISWRANKLKSDATLQELEALCAALRGKY